jgi:hypothetical protein
VGNAEECIESVTEGPCPLRIDAGVLSYEIFTPIVLGLGKIPIHRTRVRVSKFPAEGAGGDDGVVPDPCLVEGAVGSTICVLDEWLA